MTDAPLSLFIDVSNPDGLAQGIEQVLEKLEEAKQAQTEAENAVRHWTGMYDRLRLLAGDIDQSRAPSIRAQVVQIVNGRGKATKADHVIHALGGVERSSVNWALWDAARNGEIRKLATGIYVPLTYEGTMVDAIVETTLDEVNASRGAPS